MGVTKQYLRVSAGPVFGVIGSQKSNVVTFPGLTTFQNTRSAVGACEHVYIWDLTLKERVGVLLGDKSEVTCLCVSPKHTKLAVGYNDGTVKIFSLATSEVEITFQGHKSTVTCMAYDEQGLKLVSGSKDTDIIVWDIVGECGLYRMKGHRKEITQLYFMKNRNVLVSSSKDMYVKFWDLDTQHCFYTVVGHRTEVYGFVFIKDERRLVTASADSELRVWNVLYLDRENQTQEMDTTEEPDVKRRRIDEDMKPEIDEESDDDRNEEEKAEDESMRILSCVKVGSVMRQGKDRSVTLTTDPRQQILFCHGTDRHLEAFFLPNEEELVKLKAKRTKKLRKKHGDTGVEVDTSSVQIQLKDEIKFVERFKFSSKLRSMHCSLDMQGKLRFCVLLNNNKLETGVFVSEKNKLDTTGLMPIALSGHRTEVRTLSISSTNANIVSGSSEEIKIWNRDSLRCVSTMTCDYALCSLFVTGDRHVMIGTKSGKLQLFDVHQGLLLQTIEAHSGATWSITAMPDKRGIVSGGADQLVKFWNYELVKSEDASVQHKVLTLEHSKTMKMDEDVLCVKFTPDHKLLAVALLDNTVKVFFSDTLKFFLSLYGHKLPVICMDISSDSTLIVTGSADRNIKIWGLDFGDCHKSIFAHDESVTCVQFVPKTHLFYSGGKDSKVKQWDADNFECVQILSGHHGEVRCLAVSPSGHTVVSSSHDKSLRLWEKTEEPLVLEDERETERETEEMEAVMQEGEEVIPGETSEEVKMAGKKTMETLKGTESIMEALEIYKEQIEAVTHSGKSAPAHPMMTAYNCESPADFVLAILRKIRASDFQGALLSLPFSYVKELLPILDALLLDKKETELVCKCLNFLLKIHHGEITSNQVQMSTLEKLRNHSVTAVKHQKNVAAFNMSGLAFLQKQLEESKGVLMFADATTRRKKKKRAILTVK